MLGAVYSLSIFDNHDILYTPLDQCKWFPQLLADDGTNEPTYR